MSTVTEVTDATFDAEVLEVKGTVLVDIWATWCAPCRQMAPIIDELAAKHGETIKFVKIDADSNPETVAKCGVVSVPTFNVYRDGELVKSVVGGQPKPKFLAQLSEFLG